MVECASELLALEGCTCRLFPLVGWTSEPYGWVGLAARDLENELPGAVQRMRVELHVEGTYI